jgi:hypothetical protein
MITEEHEEVFIQASESSSLKFLAAISALVITALVFVGYAYLKKRHAQSAASNQPAAVAEPRLPLQAAIEVDEALLQGSNTVLGGSVKNISSGRLNGVSVELELKRRKDGTAERMAVPLNPADLDPSQEGRYSLQLKAQDYVAAKVVGLHSASAALGYTLAPGAKRPPERLETKTITVGKPQPGKGSEFLNSPDNPARVP